METSEEERIAEAKSFLALLSDKVASYFRRVFRHSKREVGIAIDGPNLLRKVEGKRVSLKEIREKAEKFGHIAKAVAILSPDAPSSLIKALTNSGFEPKIIAVGDVHVALAVEVMKFLKEEDLDVIIIGSRDTRCVPIINKVKAEGAVAIAMGFEPGFAVALKNAADEVIYLNLEPSSEGANE